MLQPLYCALCCASGSLPISQRRLSNATVPCTRSTDRGSRCSIVEQLGWGEGYIRVGGTTREPSAVNHWRTHHRKEEGGYEAGTKHDLTAVQTWWSPHQGRSSANWWRANGETQWNFRGTVIKTKVAHSINSDNAHCGNYSVKYPFVKVHNLLSPLLSVFLSQSPQSKEHSLFLATFFSTQSPVLKVWAQDPFNISQLTILLSHRSRRTSWCLFFHTRWDTETYRAQRFYSPALSRCSSGNICPSRRDDFQNWGSSSITWGWHSMFGAGILL